MEVEAKLAAEKNRIMMATWILWNRFKGLSLKRCKRSFSSISNFTRYFLFVEYNPKKPEQIYLFEIDRVTESRNWLTAYSGQPNVMQTRGESAFLLCLTHAPNKRVIDGVGPRMLKASQTAPNSLTHSRAQPTGSSVPCNARCAPACVVRVQCVALAMPWDASEAKACMEDNLATPVGVVAVVCSVSLPWNTGVGTLADVVWLL
jgi:hypothetical protein